jgi:outer membrane receptor protein involved in Fe transport
MRNATPVRHLLVIALVLACVSPVWAQSKTTSQLTGTVKGQDGGVVVGASVTIASPQLIGGARTALTDAKGVYRFSDIAPGTYEVTVVMPGFKTVKRENVRLEVGQTIDVPVPMVAFAGEETVTVTGEAPVIDRVSSETTTVLNNDYLQNLPTARFQPDVINLAPGINLDAAYGGGESSANAYQLDGVDVSDPEAGTPWSFVNYNIIESSSLVGIGAPAEYGGFTGVVFNSVTKSGGNKLSGLAEMFFSGPSLSGDNLPSGGLVSPLTNKDIGTPEVDMYLDGTAQVGGPIQKDKLWYFVSAQYYRNNLTNGSVNRDTGEDEVRKELSPRLFGKLTWQINANNKLESWVEWDRYDILGRGLAIDTPLEATVSEDAPEYVWNATWTSVLSPTMNVNVAYSGYTGYYYLHPQNGLNIAGRFNEFFDGTYSRNSTYFYYADRDRHQLNASLSKHVSDWAGAHDFKFGMEVERSTMRSRYGYTTGEYFYDYDPAYYTQDDPGTPAVDPGPYSLSYYGNDYDVNARNSRLSLFVQDSWQITPRFTLNPGIRADINRGHVTGGTVFKTEPIAWRLGFNWLLTGDGRTVLKGHIGRYYEALFSTFFYNVDPGAFAGGGTRFAFPSGASIPSGDFQDKLYTIDPNIKHPYMDQYSLSIARELTPGLKLEVTGIYRKNQDFIESVGTDPYVPVTGFIPTEADRTVPSGKQITLFDFAGTPGELNLFVTNDPRLHRDYKGVIVTLEKRLSKNWQILSSYVYSKAKGNIDNVGFGFGGGNGGPGTFLDTPNSLVNAEGTLTHDQTNQLKLQGEYILPGLGLRFGVNYTYFTGDTWTRRSDRLLVDDGAGGFTDYTFAQGRFRYYTEERGSRRLDDTSDLDLRVAWQKAMGPGTLGLALDVFNVLNQGRAESVYDRGETPDLGSPTEWNLPVNARVSARYSF